MKNTTLRNKKGQFENGNHSSYLTEFKKGEPPWIKGKHHTEETKNKMKTSRKYHIPWNKDRRVNLICKYCNKKFSVPTYRNQTAKYC